MSEVKKLCPKCNTLTMEPVGDCVVPAEQIGLLQQPISTNTGLKVMPYHCPDCRYVELYSTGPLLRSGVVETFFTETLPSQE
jgi:predicted nucleic-acid-binding Zn-ribbon protein